jgi:hypothetical protein
MANSHYLEQDRLANVIAAIQILGVSDRASGTLNRWVAELEASEELTSEQLDHSPVKFAERKKWLSVFEQHPEFFKTYTLRGDQRVLLRMRYAQSVSSDKKPEAAQQSAEPKDQADDGDEHVNATSKPLTADQIEVLIKTAIELHGREALTARGPERFRPFLMATLGAVLGTLAGGVIIVILGMMQGGHHAAARLFD